MRIVLVRAVGLKSLSGLQMHTPNPPLGLAKWLDDFLFVRRCWRTLAKQ